MKKQIEKQLIDSVASVLPIFVLVILMSFIINISYMTLISFCFSTILIMIGISLFTFGSEISMNLIGEKIGINLVKKNNIFISLIIVFLIGVFITIAEPDLKVLSNQITSIPSIVLTLSIGIGVGLFLTLSVIKNKYRIDLSRILVLSYIFILILLMFIPENFVSIAFDSGGVTTGPISVPFIVALGLGLANWGVSEEDDNSFGLIALCSIGPIFVVMLLSFLFKTNTTYEATPISEINNIISLIITYISNTITYFIEVIKTLLPIATIYLYFQLRYKITKPKQIKRIITGMIITVIGLTIFLVGANTGYIPIAYKIGEIISLTKINKIIIPIGFILGYIIVKAEPAIKVLTYQIEEITEGTIDSRTVEKFLCIGVGMAVALSMLRAITGISLLYFVIPGYLLTIFLTFITPKMITAIAFDSGGAASGPLTTSFVLPIAIGISVTVGGNPITDAFGLVALVTLMPIISIQLLGVLCKIKATSKTNNYYDTTIIEYDWGDNYVE